MKADESDDLLDKFLKGELEEIPNVSAADKEGEPSADISPENLEGIKSMFDHKRSREVVREELMGMLPNQKPKERSIFQATWFRIAASVTVLLLSALAIYMVNTSGNSYASMYDTYYKPFPVAATTRGSTQSTAAVMDLYEQEKYGEVITHFKYSPLVANESGENAILLGVSYLSTDQTAQALTIFENDQYFNEVPYTNYRQWYLGLAYLKSGEIDKAKAALQVVVDQQMIHQQQARAVLGQLDGK